MRKLWITLPILFFVMWAQEIQAKDTEVHCLAENIYFEARSESTAGRMAVALVTLNRVKDERFPNTICGVVKQTKYYPSGRIDLHSCQFSWYCDGKPDTIADKNCYKDILLIAEVMYAYETEDFTRGALWYHNTKVKPKWSMVYTNTVSIDNHIFYKDVD
jgi:spore germination cell wall hydrolase CwlJ-like protein